MTAQGIETIRRTSLEKDFNRLQELISEYEVHELVVGMPKNMNGTKGERAEKTEMVSIPCAIMSSASLQAIPIVRLPTSNDIILIIIV